MKIAIIGAGKLGLPICQALLKKRITSTDELVVVQRSSERAQEVRLILGCTVVENDFSPVAEVDVVILGTRPQEFSSVVEPLRAVLTEKHVVISVMAGIMLQTLSNSFPQVAKIVRSMPNLPTKIGLGITPYVTTEGIEDRALAQIQEIFGAFGSYLHLKNEQMINGATAISGSGPGYVFSFLQAFLEGATALGFSPSEASQLIFHTVNGALNLWNVEGVEASQLKESMRLKGGTTEAAFRVLEEGRSEELFKKAIKAAFDRSIELGKR